MKLSRLFPEERSLQWGEKGFFSSWLRDVSVYFSPKRGKALFYLFAGTLLGMAMLFFLVAMLVLIGAYSYVGSTFVPAASVIISFLSFLLYSSIEEFLCRGILMPALSASRGGTAGALGSAVFFSLMHAANPSVTLLALLNAFLFGLWFASVVQRSKSLFPVFGLHAGWNFAQSLLGLQVSGNESPYALLRFESRIPWLSGGAFGPEASPLLLLLLVSLFFYLGISKKVFKE